MNESLLAQAAARATDGSPERLGATANPGGINFAVYSPGADQLWLLLFANVVEDEPCARVKMNRTGDIWHVFIPGAPNGTLYNFQAEGPFTPEKDGKRFDPTARLIDPYARAIAGDSKRTTSPGGLQAAKCIAYKDDFDWQGDRPLNRSLDETVIYEALLPAMTSHHSSGCGALGGTYLGLITKIPYLKSRATAVELMPVAEFDRDDPLVLNPASGEPMHNAWGYQTLGFFAPKSSYSYWSKIGQQVDEFKHMVRAFHRYGLEVIVDVVFNHTREAGPNGPTLCFRGLANEVYYLHAPGHPEQYESQEYPSFTGCGNTVRANHSAVRRFILDCLRYWVAEMHVDGFRFDLAPVFWVTEDGRQLTYEERRQQKSLLIAEMEADPVLANTKLIAEPWDLRQYMVGSFSDKRWSEWDDRFRNVTRRFMRGEPGVTGELATRIAGSRDDFIKKGRRAIHFVDCHDGFTLNDLVSYNEKHNLANGENNRDGRDDNLSWNCGYEGDVWKSDLPLEQKLAIEQLRNQQVKNFLTLLFLSQGVPMILYGDEVRRSRDGNNNPYNQPELEQFDWSLLDKHGDILRFYTKLVEFRLKHQIISQKGCTDPTKVRDITWHGTKPNKPDWADYARFISWVYEPYEDGDDKDVAIYVAANAWWEHLEIELPPGAWRRVIDTSRPVGKDILADQDAEPLAGTRYLMQPRSVAVFVAAK